MATRGRRPKPPHLSLVDGNPGKREIPADTPEPKATAKLPAPPAHLTKTAKRLWKDLGARCLELKTLAEIDLPLFRQMCVCFATSEDLGIQAEKTDKAGDPKLAALYRRQALAYAKEGRLIGTEFGLGASSRTRIRGTSSVPTKKTKAQEIRDAAKARRQKHKG